MMNTRSIQLLLQAWLAWETAHAWIPVSLPQHHGRPSQPFGVTTPTSNAAAVLTTSPTTTTRLYSEPPPTNNDSMDDDDDDDEFLMDQDCEDEEECEIDWDAMPTGSEDSMDTATTVTSVLKGESMRTRLEMAWQLDEAANECDVELPQSCGSEPCEDCAGRGVKPCRFCRGTAVLYMRVPPQAAAAAAAAAASNTDAASTTTTTLADTAANSDTCACPVCQQGVEPCRSCKGTGWVAEWTSLSSVHPF